eukprot:SAG31_NODE_3729_length_3943_cov_6.130593_3_plen_287_part_00
MRTYAKDSSLITCAFFCFVRCKLVGRLLQANVLQVCTQLLTQAGSNESARVARAELSMIVADVVSGPLGAAVLAADGSPGPAVATAAVAAMVETLKFCVADDCRRAVARAMVGLASSGDVGVRVLLGSGHGQVFAVLVVLVRSSEPEIGRNAASTLHMTIETGDPMARPLATSSGAVEALLASPRAYLNAIVSSTASEAARREKQRVDACLSALAVLCDGSPRATHRFAVDGGVELLLRMIQLGERADANTVALSYFVLAAVGLDEKDLTRFVAPLPAEGTSVPEL